jgi:cobalt-zinc-cadmium efflux system membrane fusion protein
MLKSALASQRACMRRRAVRLALLLGGWSVLAGCSRIAPPQPSPPPAVHTGFQLTDEQLRAMTIETVALRPFHSEAITDGRIAYDGDRATPVYSPYSGRVTRLIAPLGAQVTRGQALFELQASEYAQAASDLLTAAAQVKLASLTEQRRHAQYDGRSGSLQDWQQSQTDLAAAQAGFASVRNRLRILGCSETAIDAMLAGGRPQPEVAAVAPIAGVVVDRQIGPGQYLTAGGTTPVYTIADLSSVWLVANVREAEAVSVHTGQAVSARVLAVPGHEFSGHLDYVGAAVDPVTRRVPVHAVLDNHEHLLKPEMFADFTISTSADTLAPAVPEEAVVFEGAQARAWVMQDEHTVAQRQLTLGRLHQGVYEVTGGLAAGERVITHGALFIDRAAGG